MITMNDSYRLGDFGLFPLQEHEHPMTPVIENKTLSIPRKAGLYYFGTEIGERRFSIPIGTVNMNRNELQRNLRKFVAFLFDQYGQPKGIKIVFDYEPDKYYTVKCDDPLLPSRLVHASEFELPFTAYDPFAHSNVYADEITWGNQTITFESHYLLGHEGSDGLVSVTSPTTLDIFVTGYAVKPIIEISGSATNLTVTNNGQSFSLPSFSNADWVIDCDRYTVSKNGQSAFGEVSLREFWLNEGSNAVQLTGNNIDIDIRIKFRDRWM